MSQILTDRKIYATVSAVLRLPPTVDADDLAEMGVEADFVAHRKHGADFLELTSQATSREGLEVADWEGKLVIRADDDVDFEELMFACTATFRVGDRVIPGELTGWVITDYK